MARSQTSKKPAKNRLLYAIPLVALIGLASVYILANNPFAGGPALDYTVQMNIQESNGTAVRFIFPVDPVGESGGSWATHLHDSLGIDSSHYPVYMDRPPNPYPGYSIIHVKSRSNYTFVLGDFFSVWGMPLGPTNTVNIAVRGNFTWQMCLITSSSQVPSFLWGQEPLHDGMKITLLYYDPNKGLGCA